MSVRARCTSTLIVAAAESLITPVANAHLLFTALNNRLVSHLRGRMIASLYLFPSLILIFEV